MLALRNHDGLYHSRPTPLVDYYEEEVSPVTYRTRRRVRHEYRAPSPPPGRRASTPPFYESRRAEDRVKHRHSSSRSRRDRKLRSSPLRELRPEMRHHARASRSPSPKAERSKGKARARSISNLPSMRSQSPTQTRQVEHSREGRESEYGGDHK